MKTLKNFTEYAILIGALNKHLNEINLHYEMGLITFHEKLDLTFELSSRILELFNEACDLYPEETVKEFRLVIR